ncbi:hypothetical protein PTKIN_Ptkin14bG0053200 [Pterospermum kingtungense]
MSRDGWHLNDRHETEIIDDIVEKIYSLVPHELIGPIIPSKDFMPSKSSNLTFNQIMEALQTNGVNMTGLYGMPGVGKTTLAKQVLRHAKEQKLFDHVVMVTMTQTPDINKMQERIGESLRLKFEATTEVGKVEELWQRLKDVKKILEIIDDVWNEFELQTIGVEDFPGMVGISSRLVGWKPKWNKRDACKTPQKVKKGGIGGGPANPSSMPKSEKMTF